MSMGVGVGELINRSVHIGQITLADQVTRSDDDLWISIVNIVILCLTILGSGMILVSMFYLEVFRGRPGTTRTRIVQALIVSDFILGIVGLISSCLTVTGDGHALSHGTASCDGLGFMVTTVLWTEHGWTLILAIATFMILIYPLHWFTLWMEQRWYFLWAFVWLVSIVIGIIGYEVYGYYPSGGLCFYGANAGLYSELMQFIPRCVVCIVITILYAKLYVFLRRPDKIRLPGSNSVTGPYESVSTSFDRSRGGVEFRDRFESIFKKREKRDSKGEIYKQNDDSSSTPIPTPPIVIPESNLTLEHIKQPNSAINGPSQMKEIPPWERLELPPFQVDGERFGGPSVSSSSHSNLNRTNSLWSNLRNMSLGGGGSGPGANSRKRSSATSASPSFANSPSSRMNSISTAQSHDPKEKDFSNGNSTNNKRTTPPGLYVPRMPSIPSEDIISPNLPTYNNLRMTNMDSSNQHRRMSTDETVHSQVGEKKRKKSVQLPPSPKSVDIEKMSQSPSIPNHDQIQNQPQVIITNDESGSMNRRSSLSKTNKTRQHFQQTISLPSRTGGSDWISNGVQPGKSEPSTPTQLHHNPNFNFSPFTTPDLNTTNTNLNLRSNASSRKTSKNADQIERGISSQTQTQQSRIEGEDDVDDGEGGEWDLMKMLSQPPPGETADDRFAPASGVNTGNHYELVPESMSSYLNRKTALLMLWFPLGYLFLFSVSLIRLIYDFAGQPPTALRAISKWMVLAQGVLDAIIYGVIEWHTKRVVRKKVRKGTFSPRQGNTPAGSKLNNMTGTATGFFKNISSRVSGGGGGSGVVGAGNGTNTPSGMRTPGEMDSRIGLSSNHNYNYGYNYGTNSSFMIEEEDRENPNPTPNPNGDGLDRSEDNKTDSTKNDSTPGTGWNHDFSLGDIKEGQVTPPIPHQNHTKNQRNQYSPPIIIEESQSNQHQHQHQESPLGGLFPSRDS
ncbi:uncharacterized protein IL334_001608 [Kwoniella shivajii]|uniref:G-protein coupled receptors family 1 profile domain-containing protein n=1 Tax=Kwoniella shivajii TaxID=564305 RepID=A0ABZ1CSC9_9TREE|nr:hypothetical protein IL334_001608 [Kwoniella shivajii]